MACSWRPITTRSCLLRFRSAFALRGSRHHSSSSSSSSSVRSNPVMAEAAPASAVPDVDVAGNLARVRAALEETHATKSLTHTTRLVAVSKTKPVELLQAAYDAGQRDFGENYVQELAEKAPEMPLDIRWHFIGHLQSNKAKVLCAIPNLAVVETVDTEKLALELEKRWVALADERAEKDPSSKGRVLSVFIQVNTSGEESKSGVEPPDAAPLAAFITENCANLKVAGLMTIGMPDYTATPENFECLKKCRSDVAERLGLPDENVLELSMGMSSDFALASEMGSTNVRVGSTIFGARNYNK